MTVVPPVYATGAELLVVDATSPPGRLFVIAVENAGDEVVVAMLVPAGDSG